MKTIVSAFACLAVLAIPAAAADMSAGAPATAVVETSAIPACDDPSVIGRIIEKQHWAQTHTFHKGVMIEEVRNPRQTTARTKFTSAIEHRHCQATAYLGEHGKSTLFYMISAEMGFASIGWGVDFCLPGHDYYKVYAPNCQVLW